MRWGRLLWLMAVIGCWLLVWARGLQRSGGLIILGIALTVLLAGHIMQRDLEGRP